MTTICDICGFQNPGNPNFCGGCGVDLREPRASGSEPVPRKATGSSEKNSPSSKKKGQNSSKDENTINWCVIRATCDTQTMTFPRFLLLVMSLARGGSKLGFCGCTSCEQGYREMLAEFTNYEEKKKLKPSSREIVKKSREHDFSKFVFNIAEMVGTSDKKKSDQNEQKSPQSHEHQQGKISIDIDRISFESVILDVIKSDTGREVIREITTTNRKTKPKKSKS